jgi:hypothetical protein
MSNFLSFLDSYSDLPDTRPSCLKLVCRLMVLFWYLREVVLGVGREHREEGKVRIN